MAQALVGKETSFNASPSVLVLSSPSIAVVRLAVSARVFVLLVKPGPWFVGNRPRLLCTLLRALLMTSETFCCSTSFACFFALLVFPDRFWIVEMVCQQQTWPQEMRPIIWHEEGLVTCLCHLNVCDLKPSFCWSRLSNIMPQNLYPRSSNCPCHTPRDWKRIWVCPESHNSCTNSSFNSVPSVSHCFRT